MGARISSNTRNLCRFFALCACVWLRLGEKRQYFHINLMATQKCLQSMRTSSGWKRPQFERILVKGRQREKEAIKSINLLSSALLPFGLLFLSFAPHTGIWTHSGADEITKYNCSDSL